MSTTAFPEIVEQDGARHLLAAALAEGPAHAYLFHGPPGVGKRTLALAFAAELIGDRERVLRRTHPDVYVLEPLGDQIRIDAIRDLRHDLHMRPFEAARRVYLVFGADLMNEDAADALLKDLEEPPAYAVIVLLASELGSLPDTIRSRCQPVPFRRLSRHGIEDLLRREQPDVPAQTAGAVARVAGGRFDRARRLLDPGAADRRNRLIELARAAYLEERFDPGAAARAVVAASREAGASARAAAEEHDDGGESARDREQRLKRIARGAEREEQLEALDLLAGWYRDVLAAACGASAAALNADRLDTVAADGERVGVHAASRAVEAVAATRRRFELNLNPSLAFEALFIQLHAATTGVR